MKNLVEDISSDGSYSASDIECYSEYIIKNEKLTDNPPIRIFVNKIIYVKKIRLRLKLKYGIISNFWRLKQSNYLEALKIR